MNESLSKRKREPRQASRVHKVTVTLIAVLAVGFSAWAVVSIAGDEAVAGRSGHREHRMGAGGPLQAISRYLDLTEEQQTQIQTIATTTMEENAVLRTKMDDMREQIMTSIRENGYNEDQVRLIAVTNMPLLVDLAVLRISGMAQAYEILTPEQKAEADKFMEHGGPGRWGRHGQGYRSGSL
jgi:Spy/CpxP family protein refolding chaperone